MTSPEHPERPAVEFRKSDSRFRPDTLEFETVAGAGQFGLTFDEFGRRFVCSNRNPLQHIVVEARYLKHNPYLPDTESVQDVAPFGAEAKVWPISPDTTTASFMPELMSAPHAGTFTSACGCLIYRGELFGPDFTGNAFICEPAQNLVQRQVLSPAGATFRSGPAHPGLDFLTSPDTWFRPVFAAQGPEEALYICDMYRKVIDHPEYLPEAVRAKVDFDAGKDKGRIYRLIPEGASARELTAARQPQLHALNPQQLCLALSSSNSWVRATVFRLLLERKDQSSADVLRSIVKNPRSQPQARVAALRLLDIAEHLNSETLQLVLADPNAPVREQAVQLAEARLAKSDHLFARIATLAQDSEPCVRFQCALALGWRMEDEEGGIKDKRINLLAGIARRDGADRWTRLAVLSSVGKDIEEFFKSVISGTPEASDAMGPVMTDLSYMFGLSEPAQACLEFLTKITELPDGEEATWQPAALNGMAEALRNRGLTKTGLSPLRSLVSGDSDQARLGATRFENLVRQATKIAGQPSASMKSRQTAIRFIGEAGGDGSEKILLNLLAPGEPTEIQAAAARAYGRLQAGGWGKALVTRQRWRAYLPPVREAVLAVMSSEAGYIKTLLDALEHEDIQVWSIEPARRNQLMRHKDESIRKRALALFKNSAGANRQKVYEDYKSVLSLPTNPGNGREVFKRICAQCHTCRGEGVAVGPDLSGVHNQPPEALLLHILIPSYEIVPGYTSYEVETKDGGNFSGLIASETVTTITLRRALGATDAIPRTNIATITSSGLSLMPDELEKTMNRQELADVI
ncbi:MAG TPA: PVC-type heme-binding CxxCH protein, partial [Patescibacteria group bacterium]|nr:PVC-type heme-binding CxxCH protein [Patescibacteria group bacterium]